ncbi:hypothetical protein BBK82_31245 [Lentzea guizhouensis]|uniref:Uncharacterized protein n=1 Tax=Lentzea guizhouensis TaxID=1586287 RepID=A0A1B2HQ61_9PSEU|nr:hypothetical protein [Lentzea guizhouensis]ANZ39858.1 hypothetical protein BBK82_31245 [Lentzea guizhouensis]
MKFFAPKPAAAGLAVVSTMAVTTGTAEATMVNGVGDAEAPARRSDAVAFVGGGAADLGPARQRSWRPQRR